VKKYHQHHTTIYLVFKGGLVYNGLEAVINNGEAYIFSKGGSLSMKILHVNSDGSIFEIFDLFDDYNEWIKIADYFFLKDGSLILLNVSRIEATITKIKGEKIVWQNLINTIPLDDITLSCLSQKLFENKDNDLMLIGHSQSYNFDSRGVAYPFQDEGRVRNTCSLIVDPVTGDQSEVTYIENDKVIYSSALSSNKFIDAVALDDGGYIVYSDGVQGIRTKLSDVRLEGINETGSLEWSKSYGGMWDELGSVLVPAGKNQYAVFGVKKIGYSKDYGGYSDSFFYLYINEKGEISYQEKWAFLIAEIYDRIEYIIKLRFFRFD